MAASSTTSPAPSGSTTSRKKAASPAAAAASAPAAQAAGPSAPAPDTANDAKARKPKLVRDSFTIPKEEYAMVETLKQRLAALAHPARKSELLRAGLKLLASLPDSALRAALQAVPPLKTGRPKAQDAASAPASAVAKDGRPAAKTAKAAKARRK